MMVIIIRGMAGEIMHVYLDIMPGSSRGNSTSQKEEKETLVENSRPQAPLRYQQDQ